jgi:hypothetical protein
VAALVLLHMGLYALAAEGVACTAPQALRCQQCEHAGNMARQGGKGAARYDSTPHSAFMLSLSGVPH